MKNKNLNKRMVLNNKGMILYTSLLVITILLTACDSQSLLVFAITKFIAIANMAILYKLLPYIPARLK